MDWNKLAQLLTTGVMLGSIFALVALGWVLIYKCSGVLNLAMGELTMIGGYVCLGLYQRFVEVMPITSAFIFALIGTMIIGLILGLLTERIFLRKMIGEPILAVIMVTVGLSFFFKGMVFIIWDTDTQMFLPKGVFHGVNRSRGHRRRRGGLCLEFRCRHNSDGDIHLLFQIHPMGPVHASLRG